MSTAHDLHGDDPATADALFVTLVMDADVRRDPYPTLHAIRRAAPVLHSSLGANLARGEAVLAIGRLLERFGRLEFAEEPTFRDQFVFRGLESLRVSGSPH